MLLKVLIVQELLPHYRVPIFDLLGKVPGLDLTIAHAHHESAIEGVSFRQVPIKCSDIGGVKYTPGLISLSRQYDVVVMTFDIHWLALFALVIRRPRGLVLWGHGFGKNRTARPLRVWLARQADALMLYGETAASEFINAGLAPNKVFVAGNTIVVPEHGRDDSVPRDRFLFVGALRRRKAVGDLLQAFALIAAQCPSTVGVTVIGEGDQFVELQDQAVRLGIAERVEFKGWIHDESVLRQEFARAIAYVSPRHVGLGALHSFAYGVPVVTMPTQGLSPEIENISDTVNGRLYQGEIADLAAILLELAESPTLSTRLGESAYQHYCENRSPATMVDGMKQAILFASGA